MGQNKRLKNWNLKALLIPPCLIGILFLSWQIPLTRPFWDFLDDSLFAYLNPWIQQNRFWQNFWAFNGSWVMDWVHDLAMLFFFLIPLYAAPKHQKNQKAAELVFSILLLLFVIGVVNGTLFPEFLHTKRDSPTISDPSAFRLSTVVSWIPVKDHSYSSFPGDHGTFSMTFTCLIFYLLGPKKGLYAIFYAIFFCLPRLICGAHWFTDIFLGSLPLAILATSICFGTPLAKWMIALFEKGIFKLKEGKEEMQKTPYPE